MEIGEYIEVLRKPSKTWLFSQDISEERIHVLSKIASEGSPNIIFRLIEFLKDKNGNVRLAACTTIIHLFYKLDSKIGYYDTLKHCDISEADIDFYRLSFPRKQYLELLAIGSLNGSGYVREKAINKLQEMADPRAIQFLIYRLADWVLPVRQAALQGIQHFKKEIFIDSLIDNLPIFEWLQKVERLDLGGVYQDVIVYITWTNRAYVIAKFENYPDKSRLLIAKHISTSLADHSNELKLFLDDRHFLIRLIAVVHFDKLDQTEITQLLNDKSSKVRLQTLYCLKDKKEFKNVMKNYVADNSSTIRQYARFVMKQDGVNFAEVYNQNLLKGNMIVGSLFGLAEIGAKQYSETVTKYLNNHNIKVKKAAFVSLSRLDEESAYTFVFANLDSPYVGLRNVIINYLCVNIKTEGLFKARDIFKTGDYELKRSMLKLLNAFGG
ncbi:MAG: HEAT repeat protein [Bacteroidia bacterium]|jgi:HEAT repeat protein